jgi:hypothetical protein
LKRFAFLFVFVFSLSASAQYLGGSADGDFKTGISSKLLDGSAGNAAWFFGGSGDGDIKAAATNKLMDGTTAVLAWFYGGSGDGDSKAAASSRYMNGTAGVAVWFFGGNGGGENKTRITSSYLGDIEWVGTNSTDWNTSTNWRQNSLPSNGRVMISAAASRDLVLDRSRSISFIDFNGSNRKVNLGNHTLTINGEIRGANSNNYFRTNGTGKLKRAVGNSEQVAYPVGNDAYVPVTITNATGTQDTFSVGVINEVLYRGTSGFVVRNIPRVKATWYIDKRTPTANAGSGVNFNFSWPSGQDTGVANMILYHWDGSFWQKYTGGVRAGQSFTHNGYKGTFSPFALGDELSVLPVSWLYMNCARKTENSVVLNWATAQETDAGHFEVQRMTDTGFRSIGRVNAVGNSQTTSTYRFVDFSATEKATLYRILQKDLNGDFSYSPVCMTSAAGVSEESAPLQVRPVPADDEFQVTAPSFDEGFDYTVTTSSGSVVLRGKSYNKVCRVSAASLASGMYILRVEAPGMYKQCKLLVTHR